jgi:hypothetical protein
MRYEGVVNLSGSTTAWVIIDDIESETWKGTIRKISLIDFQPGLVTVRLAEGSRARAFSIAQFQYDEEAEHYDGAPGTLSGKMSFGPESDDST